MDEWVICISHHSNAQYHSYWSAGSHIFEPNLPISWTGTENVRLWLGNWVGVGLKEGGGGGAFEMSIISASDGISRKLGIELSQLLNQIKSSNLPALKINPKLRNSINPKLRSSIVFSSIQSFRAAYQVWFYIGTFFYGPQLVTPLFGFIVITTSDSACFTGICPTCSPIDCQLLFLRWPWPLEKPRQQFFFGDFMKHSEKKVDSMPPINISFSQIDVSYAKVMLKWVRTNTFRPQLIRPRRKKHEKSENASMSTTNLGRSCSGRSCLGVSKICSFGRERWTTKKNAANQNKNYFRLFQRCPRWITRPVSAIIPSQKMCKMMQKWWNTSKMQLWGNFLRFPPPSPTQPQRLHIQTAEQYEHLKAGQLDEVNRIIFVRSHAHPQLLSEVKQFWNSPAKSLLFYDAANNEIDLEPGQKAARAVFIESTDLFHGIPDNYKDYMLDLSRNYKVSTADLDYMIGWKAATKLRIVGDISTELLEDIDKLTEMTALRSLWIRLNGSTYERLDVLRLLTDMDGLVEVTFDIFTLTNDEQFKFVIKLLQRQRELKNWSFRQYFGHVICNKRNVWAIDYDLADFIDSKRVSHSSSTRQHGILDVLRRWLCCSNELLWHTRLK